jgi:Thioredoxin domain-containing protein
VVKTAKKEATYLFVDFYASWCSHCKDLAPTWEVLAETMTEAAMELVDEEMHHLHGEHGDFSKEEYDEALKVKLPVMVAKVDCVVHKDLCFQQQIWAYPTLRLFINGLPVADYKGDRTVLEMVHWLAHVEEQHKKQVGDDQFNVLLADESKLIVVNGIGDLCIMYYYYSREDKHHSLM